MTTPLTPYGSGAVPRSSGAGIAQPGTAWRQALWIIAAVTFFRILVAAIVPLFPDEAYYWEWSRRLAFGYFDHPPLIAWCIAAGTALFGDAPLAVRLVPILLGAVAGVAVSATARALAGDNAARFAAVLMGVMPLSATGFVLATPDAPLLAAVAVTLWAVVRALEEGGSAARRLRYWSIAGVAVGLAMASKFTGVFIAFGVLIAVLLHRRLQAQLRSAGPWLAVAIASLVMLPVLWWNVQHDWIAFRFQLGHGLGTTARGSWWQREIAFVGGQLAVVTPILLGAFLLAVRKSFDPVGEQRRFVLATIAVFCLGFFVYSATRKNVEANWPAIAWLPALVLVAASRPAMRTRWEHAAAWSAGVITLVLLSQFLTPWMPLRAARDPVARAHGWDTFAWGAEYTAAPLRADGRQVFITANRYQDAAQLAYHLETHPEVFSLNLGARRNQYDLWPRVTERADSGATLVFLLDLNAPPRGETPTAVAALAPHFDSLTLGPVLPLRRGTAEVSARRAWILHGWRGTWPVDPNDPRIIP